MQPRYDALTTSNKIAYQNALNDSNIPFAKACGSILTNYCWTESDANTSAQVATRNGIPPNHVYFGIDVWAQNTTKLAHPRITYPEKGGGGTNTGIAVVKLASLNLSAGIFAPAWAFEHFPGHGQELESAMWEGTPLPEDLTCSCGGCKVRHAATESSAIVRHAREFPAGSEHFFFTDFGRAFGRDREQDNDVFEGKVIHSQLGAQATLPRPIESSSSSLEAMTLSPSLEDQVDRTILAVKVHPSQTVQTTSVKTIEQWLPLYKLNMPADGSLQLGITFQSHFDPAIIGISFYTRTAGGLQFRPIEHAESVQCIKATINAQTQETRSPRLEEVGIHIQRYAPVAATTRILDIITIRIVPLRKLGKPISHRITNIHLARRGTEENQRLRLCWNIEFKNNSTIYDTHGIPYSNITGPFAYFSVQIGGIRIGRAYALHRIVPQELVKKFEDEEIVVHVVGVGFDGRQLADCSVKLHL